MTLADRLILREMMRPALSMAAVLVALLALENMARLARNLGDVAAPLKLLGMTAVYLMPEHLAVGLPPLVYLTIAQAVRKLAQQSELTALRAAGLSTYRIFRIPILFALLMGGAHVGLRGWLEPAGERQLDRLSQQLLVGDLGIRLKRGKPTTFGPRASFMADEATGDGRFHNVLLTLPDQTYAARYAQVTNGGAAGLRVHLEHGVMLRDGRASGLSFRAIDIALPPAATRSTPSTLMDQLDRSDTVAVARLAERPGRERLPAIATLAVRMSQGILVLCAPFLAIPLARPRPRADSNIGLVTGAAGMIAAVAISNAVGRHETVASIAGQVALACLAILCAFACWRSAEMSAERSDLRLQTVARALHRLTAVAGFRTVVQS